MSAEVTLTGGEPVASADGQESEGRRVFKNAALLGAGHSLRFVMGFATTILITDQLGTDYGLLIGAQRYVDFFRLIMLFGFNTLLIRGLAGREENAGELLGSVVTLRALLGVVFAVVAAGSAIASGYLPEHRWLLWVFVAVAWGYVGVETMTGYCEGYERMDRTAPLPVTRSLLMFGGAVTVSWLGGGIEGIACVFLFTQFLQLGFIIALSRKLLVGVRIRARRSKMGTLLREGPHYMAVGFAYATLRSMSVMMLTRFAPTAEVAMYGAALNFVDLLFMLPMLAQRAFLPVFSRTGDRSNAAAIGANGVYAFSFVLMPAAAGLAMLSESAVALYPSGEFGEAAPVLQVLALGIACTCMNSVCATYLTGQGRVNAILRAYAVALPVQAALCWMWIGSDGAVGVARGTVCAQVILCIGIVGTAQRNGLRLPWIGVGRHLLAAGLMALAIAPIRELFFPISVASGVLVYAGVLLVICPAKSFERTIGAALVAKATSGLGLRKESPAGDDDRDARR